MGKYMKLGNVRVRRLVGWLVLLALAVPLLLWAADDVKIKLTDTAGVSTFAVQDSTATTRFQVGSDGDVDLGTWKATAIALAYGGTNASLTASNGGIVYSTASALGILTGTATAGQILRSGAGAAPAWSTATYPATVASAGQILRASGADVFAASTATYPDTVATGDILYGSAANILSNRTIGSTGQELRVVGGVPTWANQTLYNQSVTSPAAGFAADTYLVGSSIAIPSNSLKAGTRYHLIFDVSKTAAGTATPIIYVRFGTAGTTGDTARLTFTFLAGTAVADIGQFEVFATFRTVGSGTSAVLQGSARVCHSLATTGLQNLAGKSLQVTSAGFDSTVASSIIGASVNGGTSAAWTIALVQAELENLN